MNAQEEQREGRMTDVISTNPRTGQCIEVVAMESTAADLDRVCAAAAAAAGALESMRREDRATLLHALADALSSRAEDVVSVADRETALGITRLETELARTCHQFRMFAEVVEEGSYLEATIDTAGDTPMGAQPDLRRMLVPVGPVAVFGASNFPLAFSLPGGDTASALAAGCPVLVKAHASHPATSQLCFGILKAALVSQGAPVGALGVVHGLVAGARLVAHPVVQAVTFTGSLSGGKALVRLIEQRRDPVPFFGEMSSLNPVVVTPKAAHERGDEIGRGLAVSATTGAGQLCTKPGLLFIPSGPAGDSVANEMADAFRHTPVQVLLNRGIADAYAQATQRLEQLPHVQMLASGGRPEGNGFQAAPLLLTTPATALSPELTEECFGPVTVIARYDDEAQLHEAMGQLPSSLTATVMAGAGETALPGAISRQVRGRAGRLIYDGYPTGVAVSWAQHHGGPWPSTNSQHTSVGATAIRRFLRPMTWQNAPQQLLPPELRDGYGMIPRRLNGSLTLPR